MKSLREGYTSRYPFLLQIEQLQLTTGYSDSGGDSEKRKRTAPQWQLPWCMLCSDVGVGKKDMMIGRWDWELVTVRGKFCSLQLPRLPGDLGFLLKGVIL